MGGRPDSRGRGGRTYTHINPVDTDGWRGRTPSESSLVRVCGWIDGSGVDGRTDGRTDGWMDGWCVCARASARANIYGHVDPDRSIDITIRIYGRMDVFTAAAARPPSESLGPARAPVAVAAAAAARGVPGAGARRPRGPACRTPPPPRSCCTCGPPGSPFTPGRSHPSLDPSPTSESLTASPALLCLRPARIAAGRPAFTHGSHPSESPIRVIHPGRDPSQAFESSIRVVIRIDRSSHPSES